MPRLTKGSLRKCSPKPVSQAKRIIRLSTATTATHWLSEAGLEAVEVLADLPRSTCESSPAPWS